MEVTMYTDGAARGNPDGPGGYGVVLHYIDKSGTLHEKELSIISIIQISGSPPGYP